MGSLSNYVENKVLDHVLKTTVWIQSENLYVGLSTSDPLDDGSGISEPSDEAYARIQHDVWDVAVSRATENTGTISFDEAASSWGTITHFFITDDETSGNIIAHGALTTPKEINAGISASFQDGVLNVSFKTGGISTYLANAVLDHIFLNTEYTPATNIYVALSQNNPIDDGSGLNEPDDSTSYIRIQHNSFVDAVDGTSVNISTITYSRAAENWGTITHFALFDTLTSGNLLFYGTINTPPNIVQGNRASFGDGSLNINID